MAYQEAVATRNSVLSTRATRQNTGRIRIYSGVKPTNADTALAGNVLLVDLAFGAAAYAAPSAGSMTANAIASVNAAATGTATFARIFQTDGVTVEGQLDVAVSASDLNLSSTSIIAGGAVNITSLTLAQP